LQKVFFHSADRTLSVKGKAKIKDIILSIFSQEKVSLERLDYIFCSDEYLLGINRKFLKHDYYTDIITFELSESDGIKGEIYISTDSVKDNAASIKITFREEVARVIFHGALHLCGYKDKKKKEIELMRSKEDYYIKLLHSK